MFHIQHGPFLTKSLLTISGCYVYYVHMVMVPANVQSNLGMVHACFALCVSTEEADYSVQGCIIMSARIPITS